MAALQLVKQPPAVPPAPSLEPIAIEILEQPTEFHRYRYESEIAEGRVGGLLLGRSSNASSKAYVKVRITGIDPRVHKALNLVVCTVSTSKEPHPYYLHGDNCKDGYCLIEKSVDQRTPSLWEVTFDRLAVICIPKSAKGIEEGMKRRAAKVPAVINYPEAPSRPYDSRNIGRIRLAFQLYIKSTTEQWTVMQAFSDEISDKKEDRHIILEELNPPEVSHSGGTEIAIYTKTPMTGISKAEMDVLFQLDDRKDEVKDEVSPIVLSGSIQEVKKHLIAVKVPDVRKFTLNDRTKATVTVRVGNTVSSELTVLFVGYLPAPTEASRKRAR